MITTTSVSCKDGSSATGPGLPRAGGASGAAGREQARGLALGAPASLTALATTDPSGGGALASPASLTTPATGGPGGLVRPGRAGVATFRPRAVGHATAPPLRHPE